MGLAYPSDAGAGYRDDLGLIVVGIGAGGRYL